MRCELCQGLAGAAERGMEGAPHAAHLPSWGNTGLPPTSRAGRERLQEKKARCLSRSCSPLPSCLEAEMLGTPENRPAEGKGKKKPSPKGCLQG